MAHAIFEPSDTVRAVLAARWPAILAALESARIPSSTVLALDRPAAALSIEGLRISSAHDPLAEAELQARLIPPDAFCATIYGVGNGLLPRLLVERPALEGITVVVMNPAVAAACLSAFADHERWLVDPRVELALAAEQSEVLPPFAALPACLKLATPEAARIRDLVELELATPYIHRHVEAREQELLDHLDANRAVLAADGDVAELFDTFAGETILVAAAGPTLADHFEPLRHEASGCPLLAVDAALRPLLEAGVLPDAVVAADSHELGLSRIFDVEHDGLADVPLVYDPVVHPPVVERWPGPRFAFYREHPRYDALRGELPKTNLWSSGSVLHPTVDLAVRMGASRVELLGADFANLHGRSHVAGAAWEKPVSERMGREHWLVNGHGERIPSQPNLIGYLRDLERYIAEHPEVSFVQTSRESAAIEGAFPGGMVA